MSHTKISLLPGIFLILLGLLLLIHQLDIFYFDWDKTFPLVFILIGLILYSAFIINKNTGAVFPGTILLLLGIFYFLRNYDLIDYYFMHDLWPVFLIIPGLAFVALFIVKSHDWGVLIPGGILLLLGTIFLFRNLHLWRAQELVEQYWPVILILIGISIVTKNLKKRQVNQ